MLSPSSRETTALVSPFCFYRVLVHSYKGFDSLNSMFANVSLALYFLFVPTYISLDVTLSLMVWLTSAAAAVNLQGLCVWLMCRRLPVITCPQTVFWALVSAGWASTQLRLWALGWAEPERGPFKFRALKCVSCEDKRPRLLETIFIKYYTELMLPKPS